MRIRKPFGLNGRDSARQRRRNSVLIVALSFEVPLKDNLPEAIKLIRQAGISICYIPHKGPPVNP
jgi:hypothetical protein